ncbi:MAG: chemotaxis protein CheW [Gammaproteobacteria bacterium]|nr:chemotaxis protein CheW [Gammaproteobacteria bacterium]
MQENDVIRCMQLPLFDHWLLLPNAAIAEVISYADFSDISMSGDSVILGDIDWRGIKVPTLSFEMAVGLDKPESTSKDRIAIIYNPAGGDKNAYIGVRLTDIPRSFRAETESLANEEIQLEDKTLVKFQISHQEQQLFIPNLDALFQLLDN